SSGGRSGRGGSDAAAEVHHVPILDDVALALKALEVLGLGLLLRAGPLQVLERRHLGPDAPPGEVGVDLAGRVDGRAAFLQVPAADLRVAGGEEGEDADGVIRGADDPVAAEFLDAPLVHE